MACGLAGNWIATPWSRYLYSFQADARPAPIKSANMMKARMRMVASSGIIYWRTAIAAQHAGGQQMRVKLRGSSFLRPVRPRNNIAGSVPAATVGAYPLAIWEFDAHELAAARTVLHRAEADLYHFADPGVVRRPTERHQLRRRTALEGPCRHVALVVDDGDVKPGMRVDELELLHRARHVEHLRLIEHGEGMMRHGGRRKQRSGYAGKAERFPGHDPLHDMRKTRNTTNATTREFDLCLLLQHDRVDVPAIVGLAAMGHAPVAEEIIRVRIGAGVDVLDRPDARRSEPRHHIAGEIEHEMLRARSRAEEARVGRVSG